MGPEIVTLPSGHTTTCSCPDHKKYPEKYVFILKGDLSDGILLLGIYTEEQTAEADRSSQATMYAANGITLEVEPWLVCS